MDVRTGKIYPSMNEAPEAVRPYLKPMKVDPTTKQLKSGRVGRNDSCPCGSGMKFKKCCKTYEE